MRWMAIIFEGQIAQRGGLAFFVGGKGVEMKRTFMVTFIALLFSATNVHEELHDRGGGLISFG